MTPGETITTKQGQDLRIISVRALVLVCVDSNNIVNIVLKSEVVFIQKTLF